jgi:hypothetical protein
MDYIFKEKKKPLHLCCSMRQFITAILLSVICLLSFQDLTRLVLFKANQAAIAAKFCINKNDKVYTCHGKCHLSKIIAQNKDTQSSDAPIPMPETERLRFVYLIENEQLISFNLAEKIIRPVFENDKLLNSSHLFDLLRPPIG